LVLLVVLLSSSAFAQTKSTDVPRVIRYAGTLKNVDGSPRRGTIGVSFSIYADETGGAPLWQEVQNVVVEETGRFSVLLGSTRAGGMPSDLFATNSARWLGIQVENEQARPRTILAAVPYALKASDAETLGGKPLSTILDEVSLSSANALGSGGMVVHTPATSSAVGTNRSTIRPYSSTTQTGGTTTAGYVPLWLDSAGTLGNSTIFQSGTGQVGVGTATPGEALDVVGRVRYRSDGTISSGFWLTDNAGSEQAFVGLFDKTSTSPFGFWHNNAWRMLIAPNGNIGMGTITPTQALDIVGRAKYRSDGNISGGFWLTDNAGTEQAFIGLFDKTSTSPYGFWHGGAWRMLITPTGNVGIGTVTPTAPLEVAGNLKISNGGSLIFANGTTQSSAAVPGVTLTSPDSSITVGGTATAPSVAVNAVASSKISGTLTDSQLAGLSASKLIGSVAFSQIASTSCTGGQLLQWNGSSWGCASLGGFATLGPNSFVGDQGVTGNVNATGVVTGSSFNIGADPFAFGSIANFNAFVGFGGNASLTGTENTAIGVNTLHAVTSGSRNTGIGAFTLWQTSSGNYNTALGYETMIDNTTGGFNTAVGMASLSSNSTGTYNTAFGMNSLSGNGTGTLNTAIGYWADVSGLALTNATAIGANAKVAQSNSLVLGGTGANAVNVGIGTTAPQATLDVAGNINASGNVVGGTNLCIAADCRASWPVPNSGTVTSVAAGTGLTASPSPITSTGTLSFDTSFGDGRYARLGASNSFTGQQSATTVAGAGSAFVGTNVGDGGQAIVGQAPSTGSGSIAGFFSSAGSAGIGVFGSATAASGVTYGGRFTNASTSGTGVYGWAAASTGTTLGGDFSSSSSNGIGVRGIGGTSTGNTYGGYFLSTSGNGTGVYGYASSTVGTTYGGNFRTDSPLGMAVYAEATATGSSGNSFGVWGQTDLSSGSGILGNATATSGSTTGVNGQSASSTGKGVFGNVSSTSGITYGVFGQANSPSGYGGAFKNFWANGTSLATLDNSGNEVFTVKSNGQVGIGTTSPGSGAKLDVVGGSIAVGASAQAANAAIHVTSSFGGFDRLLQMSPTGASKPGLNLLASNDPSNVQQWWAWGVDIDNKFKIQSGFGFGTGGLIVDASGNVSVAGNLSKGGGSFKIDHPTDPENKYLYHSFVESPDMMNVYNGNVVLDRKGEAWVELPDWFESLNRDFRYQLTAIGGPGPNLYIAKKVEKNRFKIAGGKPGNQVSWQVTGIRQDAYANAHRIPVEETKPETERGYYLHPDAFGQPPEKAIEYAQRRARSGAAVSSTRAEGH